ncbi:MAG: ABC transporter ATP-binding protein [Rhodospirillales bacterium]|nr:ABC transporter ATP-binding protein [Rhodospirillales bacterium]
MPEPSSGLAVRVRQDAPIPIDATLACAPGELLALAGPSGSGKTTILRIIAGLYRPTEGEIACNGETWLDTRRSIDAPPQRRRVGLVFQDYALFPHMSALGNVAAALGHLPRGARATRAQELLDVVHLAGLEHRRPAQMSGGQRQRVALARALAREPAVLLLDEPFSAVDQVTRRKLRSELAILRRRFSIPIVLVTHDLEEAAALADQMVVLHRGRTLQAGSPHEITTRPGSALVARLMDNGNVFEGEAIEHRPATGQTLIRAFGRTIEARHAPQFAPGERICWAIPSSHVVLHRRDRPSRGEHENPVSGIVDEMIALGENASIVMRIDGGENFRLTFGVPTHTARRNGVTPGAPVVVSLLSEGIHLIPWERLSPDRLP